MRSIFCFPCSRCIEIDTHTHKSIKRLEFEWPKSVWKYVMQRFTIIKLTIPIHVWDTKCNEKNSEENSYGCIANLFYNAMWWWKWAKSYGSEWTQRVVLHVFPLLSRKCSTIHVNGGVDKVFNWVLPNRNCGMYGKWITKLDFRVGSLEEINCVATVCTM